MREHGVPQFTVDAHRPVRAFDVFGAELLHRARLHQHAHRARPGRHPAGRRGPRPSTTRSCSPAATRRSTPSRSPTSSTPRSSATASRPSWRSPRSSAPGRPRAAPAAATRCCCGSPGPAASTCPRFYDVDYLPDGRIQPRRAQPGRRAVAGLQAHRHGPRRVAVPEAAPGAARRDRARADVAWRSSAAAPAAAGSARPGMITRPVRERRITGIGEMVEKGLKATGFEEVGLLSLSSADHTEIGDIAKGLADRYRRTRSACRCPPPGSTRSTSTWPTS